MTQGDYVYLGYANGAAGTPEFPNWKWTPNTPEAIQDGITNGYTAVSVFSFSHQPEKGVREPLRRGALTLDFDCKDNPLSGIEATQRFAVNLCTKYQLDLNHLRYWISGGKGAHIELPASLFDSDEGHPFLHKIYFLIANILTQQCLSYVSGFRDLWDKNIIKGGKGQLLRVENIRRENGRYKIPVSAEEILNLSSADLMQLTHAPRVGFETGHVPGGKSESLASLYSETKDEIENISSDRIKEVLDQMNQCVFLTKCVEEAHTLSEPEWWAFISELAPLGRLGEKLIHCFSRPYPSYSPKETIRKISEAKSENKPKTCAYIKEQEWVMCNADCTMTAPCNLFQTGKTIAKRSHYQNLPDGLYYESSNGLEKICTPLKIIGIASDFENWSWSRVVELTDPSGNVKQLILAMKEFGDKSGKWLNELMDGGLILEPGNGTRTLLYSYLTTLDSTIPHITISDTIGWKPSGGYLLPDGCYGSEKNVIYTGSSDTLFKQSGTLEDWQNNVGKYCSGNPLLVLATSFALTGMLLNPLEVEGGGVHIYGGSSKGKSTAAIVAASVVGGGGSEGGIRQWRSTDNALEKVAASHNDNFLVLDEIGQANNMTVYKTIYMLANRQGKQRLTSDCRQRKPFVWNLNFLSTGELTIGDKIREDGRMQPMTGQQVRVIDIPIDGGYGENPIQDCHDCDTPRDLSDKLKVNAKRVFGTPMRSFLLMLVNDKQSLIVELGERIDKFFADNCPEDASQQVQRVLKRFALTAAAGEIAIARGIFPYRKGEAEKAAAKYFKAWLKQRQGVEDGELLAALERIRRHFESSSCSYVDLEEATNQRHLGYVRPDAIGYKFYYDKDWVFFMLTSTLRHLTGNICNDAIIRELDKKGWLAHNSSGYPLTSKSILGHNARGLGFIPAKIQ